MLLDVVGSGRGITFYMRLNFLLKERYFEFTENGASISIYSTFRLIQFFLGRFSNCNCFL